jgi:hypothetical protein
LVNVVEVEKIEKFSSCSAGILLMNFTFRMLWTCFMSIAGPAVSDIAPSLRSPAGCFLYLLDLSVLFLQSQTPLVIQYVGGELERIGEHPTFAWAFEDSHV